VHYYTSKLQFVARDGANFDTSVEGLRGRRVGAQRNTVSGDWLERNRPGADIRLYGTQNTSENPWNDLAAGDLDAVLADIYINYDWLQSHDGQGFRFLGDPVVTDDLIGIAVRKGEDSLRKRMNAAIRAILSNGVYAKINAKYFPFSIY
jgi:ABC-type amino acid transport substrate-binding protein